MDNQQKINIISLFIFRLRELMDEKSLTQSELARITGIRQSTISEYLKGNSIPSVEKFYTMAEVFGVSMDYLWGSSEVRNRALPIVGDTEIALVKEKEAVIRLRGKLRYSTQMLEGVYKLSLQHLAEEEELESRGF